MWESDTESHLSILLLKLRRDFGVQISSGRSFQWEAQMTHAAMHGCTAELAPAIQYFSLNRGEEMTGSCMSKLFVCFADD